MIICCGEALIDMLPRKLVDGSEVFLPVPGGAIFNTAISLGRLGAETGFLCGVSTDMFGEQLIEALKESGVSSQLAVRSERPTTLAFVKLVEGAANYSFFDENSAMRMLQPDDCPPLPQHASALHFGGISLVSEPCGTTYERVMQAAKDQHVISIDPNIRAGFITDETTYRRRLENMIGGADIVKVSDEDLDWLYPGEIFEAIARRWIEAGTALVVQTLGSEGAHAITSGIELRVPSKPVKVVDTVGAGDTFNAGMLSALHEAGRLSKSDLPQITEAELKQVLHHAAAVAAYTVGQAGANSPWKSEIGSLQ